MCSVETQPGPGAKRPLKYLKAETELLKLKQVEEKLDLTQQ